MKPQILTVTLLLAGSCIIACSTAEKPVSNQTAAADRNTGTTSGSTVNSTAPANSAASVPAETNAVAQNPIAASKNDKREAMRRAAQNSPPVQMDLEAELRKSARPAPENSEFAAVLSDSVFERRTFKNHPQLVKIEKVTEGEKKSLKVYLKDGRVIDLSGDKIEFIATASTFSILQAAGEPTPSSVRKPGTKSLDR